MLKVRIRYVFIVGLICLGVGYFGGDRCRAFTAGLVSDQLRSELAAERERTAELEAIHIEDGIIISDLRKELSTAGDFIDSLTGIQWSDARTIRDIRGIIADLRAKIKGYQDSLDNSLGGGRS